MTTYLRRVGTHDSRELEVIEHERFRQFLQLKGPVRMFAVPVGPGRWHKALDARCLEIPEIMIELQEDDEQNVSQDLQ